MRVSPPGRFGRFRCLVGLALAICSGTACDSKAASRHEAAGGEAPGGSPETSAGVELTIRADLDGRAIDRRLFGTNVPAWLGPERLADPEFRAAAVASGATVARMPGGSWSNGYEWLACEVRDPERCPAAWAARPSDFVEFLNATGIDGMWTVSINETAESAAAVVAFFNGSVDDGRPIGVDRNGVDWSTVGHWAELRAQHGNREPIGVELWEVGNEVFAGRPDSGGDQCVDFGWEDVWTCDGTEYVLGTSDHDGFRDIRAAMVAVDPTILVGAVGVADPASWSNWGDEVIAATAELDFYVLHQYGFDSSPGAEEALHRPSEMWPALINSARNGLPPGVPIAVTEYNLVSSEGGDVAQSMTRAGNAFYIADTLGQLAVAGVPIANQWNLANGTTESGTDYGLVSADDSSRFPQFQGLAVWSAAGDELMQVDGSPPDDLRVYATRRDDGSIAVILINLHGHDVRVGVGVAGRSGTLMGTWSSWRAARLDDGALIEEPPEAIVGGHSRAMLRVPAWSLNLLEVVDE